jgi:crossover junction endodeoxyribonuclease RuvC
MNIVGIDPGLSGGVALVGDGALQMAVDMPVLGGEIDIDELCELLNMSKPDVVVVETVHAMPKQGVSSTFNFGLSTGMVLGTIRSLRHPLVRMRPIDWKRANGLVGQDKTASRRLAQELWPDMADLFKLVRHDGRAEAALIARAYQFRMIHQANKEGADARDAHRDAMAGGPRQDQTAR